MAHRSIISPGSRATFWRSLQTFTITRIVITVVLLLYLSFDLGRARLTGSGYAETCVIYVAGALLFAFFARFWRHRFLLQLGAQVVADISFISLLYLAGGGMRSGFALLYLFPLAGAAILAPLVMALFSAALATLFVLGESTWHILRFEDPPLMQAGMSGAAFFALVLVVNRLADKLIRQEELAVQRGTDLRIQQAIYRIVVDDVDDGILVLGRDGFVFSGNPAARRMLGLDADGLEGGEGGGFRLADVPALEPVAYGFEGWLAGCSGMQDAPQAAPPLDAVTNFVTIKRWHELDGAVRGRLDQPVHLKLRFARVDTSDGAVERSVIFMQDVSAIENQAQQLKLASMGRLTASIAHEVRNPLSAIGHATSLLAEDLHGPAETRLLRIVTDNVGRVNRMVEDILKLSRKVQPNGTPVALDSFLAELRAEFTETQGLADGMVWIGDSGGRSVRFDGLPLREVLVNLLGNAVRYASGLPASIRVFPVLDATGRVELHVQDDGPGITPEVRAHLFEPFYTTSSKGTGLGLYLARELCLNNGAMLDYEYRVDDSAGGAPGGRFVITFGASA